MNDSTEPFAEREHSLADAAKRFPSNIYPNIQLPNKIYEALPATYFVIGTLLILGAVYIGIGHWPMIGYFAVGLLCLVASVTVDGVRRRERTKSVDASARVDKASAEPLLSNSH